MSDYPQYPDPQAAGAQAPGSQTGPSYRRLAGAIDPRKAMDPATIERMIHAQVAARAQAQAATTVVLATIVSLITSAFSFVAALAWNSAIQQLLKEKVNVGKSLFGVTISEGGVQAIYAVIVTVIAVVVVLILNRIARRYASKSALGNN
jgi:hypothetical protein